MDPTAASSPDGPSPFAIFGEHARRALFFARLAVAQHGGSTVSELHLLHGVLRDDAEAVTRFAAAEWTAARLRERVEALVPREPRLHAGIEVPFSRGMMRILPLAAAGPRAAGRMLVPEDLVLALLDDPVARPAQLLAEAGVTRAAIQAWLLAS